MGGKKKGKKKGGGGEKKKKGDGDDEVKVINPDFLVKPDATGWIKLELRLSDPPFNKVNTFKHVCRSDDKILEIK